MPAALQDALETALDRVFAESHASALGVAIIAPDTGRWSGTRGASLGDLFSIGSIGKSATAAMIFNDISAGRLSLEDPISRWFPDLPAADVTTIDHLLTHHSGYRSFNSFPALRGRLPPEPPEGLVRFAVRRSGTACPQPGFAYSNTNYVLLGLLLEQEHERELHDLMNERLLFPLGLQKSRAMERAMRPPELLPGVDPNGREVLSMDYGAAHGAGNIAMNAHDLATWWHALLAGQVASPESVEWMLDGWTRMPTDGPIEMYYGRGTMLVRAPDGAGWLVGHSGGIRGFSSMVAWSTEDDAILAVTLSGSTQAEAAWWAMDQAFRAARAHKEQP